MRIYYALTDKRGVLCVDEIATDSDSFANSQSHQKTVQHLAFNYPNAIYFVHPCPD